MEPTHEELATMVRSAVSSGIKDALQDRDALDEFWGSAFQQLQVKATKQTGKFVLGSLRTLVSKALTFLVQGLGGQLTLGLQPHVAHLAEALIPRCLRRARAVGEELGIVEGAARNSPVDLQHQARRVFLIGRRGRDLQRLADPLTVEHEAHPDGLVSQFDAGAGSAGSANIVTTISNNGTVNGQSNTSTGVLGSAVGLWSTGGSIDTSSDRTIVITVQKGVGADVVNMQSCIIELLPS